MGFWAFCKIFAEFMRVLQGFSGIFVGVCGIFSTVYVKIKCHTNFLVELGLGLTQTQNLVS